MIKDYEFYMPTKVISGVGKLEVIGEEMKQFKKNKILIVTDKGVIKAGIVDKVVSRLKEAGFSDIQIYDNVAPNPRTTEVNEGYEFAKKHGSEILLSVGGGSPTDTAKGIGVLMSNGGIIEDYEGFDLVPKKLPPFVAVPTTVGTGSEVTGWAVITDLKRMFKMSVADPKLYPDIAILDPDMVSSLPSKIIASTGMDALSHAIEGYVCKIATPVSDAVALYAIELIGKNIREAVYGDSYDAKANMQLGSMLAGIAIAETDVAGVHCMGEALGGMYDTPHGIANASVLPYVMKFSCIADMEKYAKIAECLGVDTKDMTLREAAEQSAIVVKQLNDDMQIPSLQEIGVKPEDFQKLSDKAAANMSNPDNPRDATSEDYFKLFEDAYAYNSRL